VDQRKPRRRGFLALPYLGIHSFRGDSGNGLDSGLRLGTLLGGRVNEQFSLNGELTIDVINPSNVPTGVDFVGAAVDIAFSPLIHISDGGLEVVLGPKLGFWSGAQQASMGGVTAKARASGAMFGVNGGVFGPINDNVSIGVLLSFVVRTLGESCITEPGVAEVCDSDPSGDADKVLGVTGGMLF
jgi:hypothetical protein